MARGLDEKRLIANLSKEKGIAVFSAASRDESAFEIKDLGHGIFTYAMLETLSDNRQIRSIAYKYLGTEQSPVMYLFGDDFAIGR